MAWTTKKLTTLFDHTDERLGNLSKLDSALERLKDQDCFLSDIPGIHGYLYFGSLYTMTVMHTEDGDFHSVNFMHSGAPKLWLSISQSDLVRAVELIRTACRGTTYAADCVCEGFLRHKLFTATPVYFYLYENHSECYL